MKRRTILRVTAAVVAVLVITAAGVGVAGSEQPEDAELVGYFADASPLDPGSQIRLAGVNVGNVDRVELQDGKARVTFTVDPSVLPVHDDAGMVIRPVNLLGESYVDLHSGTPSKPFVDTAVVPVERTSTRVTLEEVLNTFDNPTSTALAVLVTTAGEGMHGSGAEVGAALKALAPAMRDTQRLARLLDEQNSTLTDLVELAEPVSRAVAADDGKVLDRTVQSTERMLSTVAANRKALQDTLAELPGTLVTARRTLRNLAGTADATAPTLAAMRPLTDDLNQVTGELQRFADAADPALASLEPVLRRADELLDQAGPAVAELRKAGPDLRNVAKDLRPLGETLLDRHLSDLMEFVKKWSLSTNGRDALGNYFRGAVWVTPGTLQDMLQTPLPHRGGEGKGKGPATPNPTSPVPGLPGLAPSDTPDPNGATGLTEQQEQSLVDQLLGGI